MIDLSRIEGFDWDDGNKVKNYSKHFVTKQECEEIFFNTPLLLFPDQKHSAVETRLYVLGITDLDRLLFASFTIRQQKIRIISTRDMSKKEKSTYKKNNI